ncbi:alpha/beta hydrolase family protein [Ohtaekwangia koreensis]|uniref:Glutamyl peptidase. Serine peptidase. MEROPS family S09D n=1 Tax=Ohtaekwangia koreensis TaxID=688867 RepID=A0A1T5M551_9BACT|nr:prolyl oligopeptidase family serine peptidase [Ohtaekwangia koreensis]SKC83362.1 glutamyl peptidase. Serine peptidase. MEROPS family S09D [Ohtaekwangia koreensis]
MAYQKPSPVLSELYESSVSRKYLLSPDKQWLVILACSTYISIDDMTGPELTLAGLSINPDNFSKSRQQVFTWFAIRHMESLEEFQIASLPQALKANNIAFSPDSKRLAFQHTTPVQVQLWIVDLQTMTASLLSLHPVHTILTSGYAWLNNTHLLVLTPALPDSVNTTAPVANAEPTIFDTDHGKKSNSRTFPNLLRNRHEESLFEFYTMSQMMVYSLDGPARKLGAQATYASYAISPDARYILMRKIIRPYSHSVPHGLFPQQVSIFHIDSDQEEPVHTLPLQETESSNFSAVSPFPRHHHWRGNRAATLCWVEAQDDGEPGRDVAIRDALFERDASGGTTRCICNLPLRYGQVYWGDSPYAFIYEWWWENRKMNIYTLTTEAGRITKQLLLERSFEDPVSDPGKPMTFPKQFGTPILYTHDREYIYLTGERVLPMEKVKISFLNKLSLRDGSIQTLWTSRENFHEQVITMLDAEREIILISRESPTHYPNLVEVNLQSKHERYLTKFPNPFRAFESIRKERLHYRRQDGISLLADIYLPAGFQVGDAPLPCLVWAYPQDFKDKRNAEHAQSSTNTFPRVSWDSLRPWVLKGYAVLERIPFPIVDTESGPANDTFIEQLIMNAEAVLATAAAAGLIDMNRVAIGGHSYGAFMVANLMTHSTLFKRGIARSGAYNRTLTPFGFQNEERTLWQADHVYHRISPFNYAHLLKGPLLLLHGACDDNPGTAPLQSERYFHAIKSNGGTARLVLFPYEKHTYQAKESILHMVYEMEKFLEDL